MSASTETRYAAEDLLTLPDRERCELIDGQLVEKHMGAESSLVAALAIRHLGNYAAAHHLGLVFAPDCGYQIFREDPDRVRKPDASFIKRGRLPDDQPPKGHIRIPPDLAIEVVSPNDLADSVDAKVEDLLRAGVPLVWLFFPRTRRVQVYRQDGTTSRLTTADELSGETVLPGFVCRVEEFFAGV